MGSTLPNPSFSLFWVIKTSEKEKKVETPIIDLAERATVRLVRVVFGAARAVVRQFKELVKD